MTRTATLLGVLSCVSALPATASAAQVKGIVDAPPAATARGRVLGYTRTKLSSPAAGAARKADLVVMLSVKTSLPIPPATDPFKVSISGLRVTPSVAGCVVDQKVTFTNEDRAPITLLIDQQAFATVGPGETKTYDCAAPGMHKVRVKEWPHIRATIHVGEIGVVTQLGPNGAFALAAPQGKYELQVLGEDGPIAKREVEIVKADIDVGRIQDATSAQNGETTEPKTIEGLAPNGGKDAAKDAPKDAAKTAPKPADQAATKAPRPARPQPKPAAQPEGETGAEGETETE